MRQEKQLFRFFQPIVGGPSRRVVKGNRLGGETAIAPTTSVVLFPAWSQMLFSWSHISNHYPVHSTNSSDLPFPAEYSSTPQSYVSKITSTQTSADRQKDLIDVEKEIKAGNIRLQL